MDSTASTTNGLATPPLPTAQPLVYITGSSAPNKQCVAEYLALLLGDEAILIDRPSTSTWTPPPPSSTPPNEQTTARQRPKRLRLLSSTSSSSSKSTRSRSTSTTTTVHHPPSPFFDPLLVTLSSHPLHTAILTDTKPSPISPFQAASQTGRPLITVRLSPSPSPFPFPKSSPPELHPTTGTGLPNPQAAVATAELDLVLLDGGGGGGGSDPHAAALRIVQFVKELNARRRSRGDWEAVNDALQYDGGRVVADGMDGKGIGGNGGCVCGVITPVLTPADEREIRF